MITSIYMRVYWLGLERWSAPRWLRRLLARTEFHRAWLSGWHGYFVEGGIQYGLTNPYRGDV